jgi:hypothetical protein
MSTPRPTHLNVAVPTAAGVLPFSLLLVYDNVGDDYVIEAPAEYTEFAGLIDPPAGVRVRKVNGHVYFKSKSVDRLSSAIYKTVMAAKRHERAVDSQRLGRGSYVASRASIPARAEQWRYLRDIGGWHITSTWIDEAGEGETDDFSELWVRIEAEIKQSERLILYVEANDFPIRGALIEVGIALAAGVPVYVVAPGVAIEPRSRRPVGSWMDHPLVTLASNMGEALEGSARREIDMHDIVQAHLSQHDRNEVSAFTAYLRARAASKGENHA